MGGRSAAVGCFLFSAISDASSTGIILIYQLFFRNWHNSFNPRVLFPVFSILDGFFYRPYPFEKQDDLRFQDGLFIRTDELESGHPAAGAAAVEIDDAQTEMRNRGPVVSPDF